MEQTPMIKLLVPFLLGIICYIHEIHIKPYISVAFLGLFFCIYIFLIFQKKLKRLKYQWIIGITFFWILLTLGYLSSYINSHINYSNNISKIYQKGDWVYGVIHTNLSEKEKTFKTTLKTKYIVRKDSVIKVFGMVDLYFDKTLNTSLNAGDWIALKGLIKQIESPKNPEEFNYKKYLSYRNIYQTCYISSNTIWSAVDKKSTSLYYLAQSIQKNWMNVLKEHGLHADLLSVSAALLLGEKSTLSDEISQAYSASGAMHVLAVSGLHVGLIFVFLQFIFNKIDKRKKFEKLTLILMILFLWFYALITGFSASVVRASTMFSIHILGKIIKREANIYNSIFSSAFIILMINPFMITEVGFQLSYCAVLGIVYIFPKLYEQIPILCYFTKQKHILFIVDNIYKITCVSIAAQMSTLPFSWYYFHQFPNYFILSNIIVIPLATVTLYVGISFFLGHYILFGMISKFLAALLMFLVKTLNYVNQHIEKMPYALLNNIYLHEYELILFYFLIIFWILYLYFKKHQFVQFSGIIIALWIVFNISALASQLKQRVLIIYHIPNLQWIDIIQNKKVHSFTHHKINTEIDEKLNFFRNHFILKNNFKQQSLFTTFDTTFQYKDFLLHHRFLKTQNLCLYSLHKNDTIDFDLDQLPVWPTHIIIQNEVLPNKRFIVHKATYILDGSIKYTYKKKWLHFLKKHQLKYHLTSEKGAYIISI